MTKKFQELQAAQQIANGQSQKLAVEYDTFSKEVGRLRHLEQNWMTPTRTSNQPPNSLPQPIVATQSYQSTRTPLLCYNCDQPGHFASRCPEQRPRRNGPNGRPVQLPLHRHKEKPVPLSVNGATKHNRLAGAHSTYVIGVIGLKECDCLLDTGSETSLLPASMVEPANIIRSS